jgi:DNA-binding CsgD family transcriptional regulator
MEEPTEEPIANQSAELSEREVEILRLLATGLSNKEIAAQLFLSVNTIKVHLRNVFNKLNVQSRTEATLFAIQHGYVTVPGAAAGDQAANGTNGAAAVAPVAPAIVIEPPLPIGRRIALVGLAIAAIAIAVIAGPHESAQSGGSTDPGTDSQRANSPIGITAGDTVWQAMNPMSLARSRLAVTSIGLQVMAIGGEAVSGVTGSVEIWDMQTQQSRAGQNKPTPVANISAVVISSTVIVPGGYTAAGVPTSIVEAYTVVSDTWTQLAPLPAPRFGYAMVAYHDKVYVFGGWDGKAYVDTTFVYDPAENRWTTGARLPIARGFSGAAVLNDAVYVVGGYTDGHEFNRCDRYLPDEDRWEGCPPMTVARGGIGLVNVAGRLYAIGGGWIGYLTFNERFDPQSETWTVVPTPFTGQWRGMGVATIGNDIYALGGWNGQYLSTIEKYNPFPIKIFVPAATR